MVWSFLGLGHRLVISFITVGSLSPLCYPLIVSCSNCTKTLLNPLPLLLSEPHPTFQNTTLFLDFPHILVVNSIHLPCIIPSNPSIHGTRDIHTPDIYSSKFIFNILFSQILILIHSCKDNRNLPQGSLKNSIFASL